LNFLDFISKKRITVTGKFKNIVNILTYIFHNVKEKPAL